VPLDMNKVDKSIMYVVTEAWKGVEKKETNINGIGKANTRQISRWIKVMMTQGEIE